MKKHSGGRRCWRRVRKHVTFSLKVKKDDPMVSMRIEGRDSVLHPSDPIPCSYH